MIIAAEKMLGKFQRFLRPSTIRMDYVGNVLLASLSFFVVLVYRRLDSLITQTYMQSDTPTDTHTRTHAHTHAHAYTHAHSQRHTHHASFLDCTRM